MKYLLSISFVLLALFTAAEGQSQQVRNVQITKAYLPQGFDDNDVATFMIEGYLLRACHRLGPLEKKITRNTIVLEQKIYRFDGPCPRVVTKFEQHIFLGLLRTSNYKIIDKSQNEVIGILPVKEATNKFKPDDFDYANVLDVNFDTVENVPVVTLKGSLPNACWTLTEVRKATPDSEDVVTLLPIIDKVKNDTECAKTPAELNEKVELKDLQKGKYLLHVRSASGKAITKIIYPYKEIGDEE